MLVDKCRKPIHSSESKLLPLINNGERPFERGAKGDDSVDILEYPFTGGGQTNAIVSPIEQARAKVLLQLTNLESGRGRGDVQRLGCLRETQQPRHCVKHL